jgi:hypothetical protein
MKPMAIRHMKYGVTAQNVKRFQIVFHNVLKRCLGDAFDEDSQMVATILSIMLYNFIEMLYNVIYLVER